MPQTVVDTLPSFPWRCTSSYVNSQTQPNTNFLLSLCGCAAFELFCHRFWRAEGSASGTASFGFGGGEYGVVLGLRGIFLVMRGRATMKVIVPLRWRLHGHRTQILSSVSSCFILALYLFLDQITPFDHVIKGQQSSVFPFQKDTFFFILKGFQRNRLHHFDHHRSFNSKIFLLYFFVSFYHFYLFTFHFIFSFPTTFLFNFISTFLYLFSIFISPCYLTFIFPYLLFTSLSSSLFTFLLFYLSPFTFLPYYFFPCLSIYLFYLDPLVFLYLCLCLIVPLFSFQLCPYLFIYSFHLFYL